MIAAWKQFLLKVTCNLRCILSLTPCPKEHFSITILYCKVCPFDHLIVKDDCLVSDAVPKILKQKFHIRRHYYRCCDIKILSYIDVLNKYQISRRGFTRD